MNSQEMDLIHEAQQGNVRAFENIVKKYERRVLALAFQVVGNIQDAEDVHQ